MGMNAVVMADSKVGTVNLLIFVLERTAIIMETVQVKIIATSVIVMQDILAKIATQLIIVLRKIALIVEHVVQTTTPMNVYVILDLLVKTVSTITVLVKPVLIMAGVKTGTTPIYVTATMVTRDTIVNTLTVIQTNVKMAQRV